MNQVFLMGNLGKDPEVINANMKVAKATMATSKFNKKENNFMTTWHNIVAFGKTAEKLTSMKKGSKAFISGSISNTVYTNKEGKKVSKSEVIVNTIDEIFKGASDKITPDNIQQTLMSEEDIPF